MGTSLSKESAQAQLTCNAYTGAAINVLHPAAEPSEFKSDEDNGGEENGGEERSSDDGEGGKYFDCTDLRSILPSVSLRTAEVISPSVDTPDEVIGPRLGQIARVFNSLGSAANISC